MSGWRGLYLLSATGIIASGIIASAAVLESGRPAPPVSFGWPLAAIALGGIPVYLQRRRLHRQLRHAASEIQAAAGHAELAGQNSVAMGADSVVDLLARTTPLLAITGQGSVASPLFAWKRALAEQCSGDATYLGVALAKWQRRHNGRTADLSTDVELRLLDGAGTVLLSPAQALVLERTLERLSLCGNVTVRACGFAPAGTEQLLLVGGHTVTLPADRRPLDASMGLGPMAFLASGLTGVGIAGVGLALHAGVSSPVPLLGALAWSACAVLASVAVHRALRDATGARAMLERQRAATVDAGFRRGRRMVVDLADRAAAETRTSYQRVRADLPPPVAAEIERRLDEVNVRLAALRAADGRLPSGHGLRTAAATATPA